MLFGCGSKVRCVGSDVTSSSSKLSPEGPVGGIILYVMRTFLALRHIGSVEWVTDHVPWSHSRGGAVKELEDGTPALYFVAERREIAGLVEGPEEV